MVSQVNNSIVNYPSSLTPHKVFVYGTLKKGYGNHERHLRNAKFLGVGVINGIMFHLGGYPAINISDNFCQIKGEVYQCSWEDILEMDKLEGHPSFYTRIEVAMVGYPKVWTYIMERNRLSGRNRIVPTGVWEGSNTPTIEWKGFGQGALIGSFQTEGNFTDIKVGEGTSFSLRMNPVTNKYSLFDIASGNIIGGEYSRVTDVIARNKINNIIALPHKSANTLPIMVGEEIKTRSTSLAATGTHVHGPIYNTYGGYLPPPKKEIEIPLTAKILDIKVGPA
jgi:gamma-glutamylcyclotransferase (GGCT)/AIG2-like uncharacterized protein YtfP